MAWPDPHSSFYPQAFYTSQNLPHTHPGANFLNAPLKLNLTAQEVINVVAFMKTLTGTNVYVDTKWKNPFL